jgi:hypothetical protein
VGTAAPSSRVPNGMSAGLRQERPGLPWHRGLAGTRGLEAPRPCGQKLSDDPLKGALDTLVRLPRCRVIQRWQFRFVECSQPGQPTAKRALHKAGPRGE